ncbi:MAG: LysR substrate-binding domain-containing protein [Gammaproteobacteria bacterium]
MLEIRHLRALLAIRDSGSLAQAALRLHLTQSALSHQIKALEQHYGARLFQRKSKPLNFTTAGQRLLALAEQILGHTAEAERDLARLQSGQTGRLSISIECHSCFEWLMPSMNAFREHWPEVEMDLSAGFNFDSLPALLKGGIDLVITSDLQSLPGVQFEPLFGYQALLVMANDHPLTEREWIEPQHLANETLITYPVPRNRLDIFKRFLEPAGVEPAGLRTTELTLMMAQLVASRRGVAALPNWVVEEYRKHDYITARPLGRAGLWGTLYAALRANEAETPYMREFISVARETSFRTLTGIRDVQGRA